MVREVAESCIEGVMIEMVSTYCRRFYANKPDLAARRIEAIGYQVGHQLIERYTMERPRFSDHLEAIKFICKDFWSQLFKKHIDNLKTNHRGTFVLQDNKFHWLTHVSVSPSSDNNEAFHDPSVLEDRAFEATSMLLYFPCGIIRGALSNLGITCAVSADISNLPACAYINGYRVKLRKGVWPLFVESPYYSERFPLSWRSEPRSIQDFAEGGLPLGDHVMVAFLLENCPSVSLAPQEIFDRSHGESLVMEYIGRSAGKGPSPPTVGLPAGGITVTPVLVTGNRPPTSLQSAAPFGGGRSVRLDAQAKVESAKVEADKWRYVAQGFEREVSSFNDDSFEVYAEGFHKAIEHAQLFAPEVDFSRVDPSKEIRGGVMWIPRLRRKLLFFMVRGHLQQFPSGVRQIAAFWRGEFLMIVRTLNYLCVGCLIACNELLSSGIFNYYPFLGLLCAFGLLSWFLQHAFYNLVFVDGIDGSSSIPIVFSFL
ncbi:trafficking protein particle complex subunit 6B [Canna indica]|uniref:Trafficking protein particle complex subunit 6B n=1 Tax=Canna indica TaxID=4628 RepID=A0AAQ3KXV7_9LILI|nr:trafficking protein particle complex subunit 6B [Canna indica]